MMQDSRGERNLLIKKKSSRVAVIDYGLGNLFSVSRACEKASLTPIITSCAKEILKSDAVILPGVGGFPDAMSNLNNLDLIQPLKDYAQSNRPMLGICLGMQLLMSESYEFVHTKGLNIINGDVIKLGSLPTVSQPMKVPQVGWNKIIIPKIYEVNQSEETSNLWDNTLLKDISHGSHMYFVHSFYVRPTDPSIILSDTDYGDMTFCSSYSQNNIMGCQFHPEKSGTAGLLIYHNLSKMMSLKTDVVTEDR